MVTAPDAASPRHEWTPGPADRAARLAMTALGTVPDAVVSRLSGAPRVVDGARLDPAVQLGLRVMPSTGYQELPVAEARAGLDRESYLVSGRRVPLPSVRAVTVPGAAGDLAARLYSPVAGDETLPLLLFFHGGGWVLGGLDSHDAPCRHLCRDGRIRVLSVDYRLAPEHTFPAAADDALAVLRHVLAEPGRYHADPDRIAVGGDSAGGNITASACVRLAGAGERGPAFQLLVVPAVDFSRRTRSREMFGEGYFLTEAHMDFYERSYLRTDADRTDPVASPLLAGDLSGLPPTHVSTAGFDPLRDEGEAFARAVEAAGVPVTLRRHASIVHPFLNTIGISRASRVALDEIVADLRAALE